MGLPEAEYTEETCIIVLNVATVEIGTIVDKVSEVLDIAGHEIEDPPSFKSDSANSFRDKRLKTSFFHKTSSCYSSGPLRIPILS